MEEKKNFSDEVVEISDQRLDAVSGGSTINGGARANLKERGYTELGHFCISNCPMFAPQWAWNATVKGSTGLHVGDKIFVDYPYNDEFTVIEVDGNSSLAPTNHPFVEIRIIHPYGNRGSADNIEVMVKRG